MILLAEKAVTFKLRAEQLFLYLTNMENYGDWFPGVVEIKSKNLSPHASVGKKYEEILTLPTGTATLIIEVKESSPNKLLYTEGDLSPLFPAMKMVFDEIDHQTTTFRLSYYSRNPKLSANDDIIKLLRADLSDKIELALNNLLEKL